jgi:hypothetical protein
MDLLALLLLSVALIEQILHGFEGSRTALRPDLVPLLEKRVQQLDESLLTTEAGLQIGQFLLRDVHDLSDQLIFRIERLRILAYYC